MGRNFVIGRPARAFAECLGCPVVYALRAMEVRWIPALAGGTTPFLDVALCFVRVYVLLEKARRRRLPENGIRFSPSSSHSGGVSSTVGGYVKMCLWWIYLSWTCSDLLIVCLHSCVFGLDSLDLRYSSSAMVAVLVRWFYEVLTRRISNCLPQ